MNAKMISGCLMIAAAVLCGAGTFLLYRQDPLRYLNVILTDAALFLLVGGISLVTRTNHGIHVLWRLFAFMVVPLAAATVGGLLLWDGFVMLKKEGMGISTLLAIFSGAFLLVGMVLTVLAYKGVFVPNVFMRSMMTLIVISSFFVAITFCTMIGYSEFTCTDPRIVNCDYIVVHGCRVFDDRMTPLLRGRVDKAVALMEKAGPETKMVVSGGQGPGETISEAQAMWNYLDSIGFDMDRVIMEDTSTTTDENLRNVRDMLDGDGVKHRYLCVTSDYHAFRTGVYARKLGLDARTCGSHTALYYWPSAVIREYAALMVSAKWLNLLVLCLWAALAYHDAAHIMGEAKK